MSEVVMDRIEEAQAKRAYDYDYRAVSVVICTVSGQSRTAIRTCRIRPKAHNRSATIQSAHFSFLPVP